MNPSQTTTRQLTLSHHGTRHSLRFPGEGLMEAHIRAILAGETYPFRWPPGPPPGTIVDIGANVGAAAVYFLAHAPQARLFAFEPAAATYALLAGNLHPFANAQAIQAGLFHRDDTLELHRGLHDCTENSIVTSGETAGPVERIDLRRASSEFTRLGIADIAILKLDTEGCEVPILRDIQAWLPRIDQIHVEYHSEDDRRDIDALLAEHFLLCRARCDGPHRGVNTYVARRVMDADPRTEAVRLPRPA